MPGSGEPDGLLLQNIYSELRDKNYKIDSLLYFLDSLTDGTGTADWDAGQKALTMDFDGMLSTAREVQPDSYKFFQEYLLNKVSGAIQTCNCHMGTPEYDWAKAELLVLECKLAGKRIGSQDFNC